VRERLKGFIGRPLNTAEIEKALTRMTGQGKYEASIMVLSAAGTETSS